MNVSELKNFTKEIKIRKQVMGLITKSFECSSWEEGEERYPGAFTQNNLTWWSNSFIGTGISTRNIKSLPSGFDDWKESFLNPKPSIDVDASQKSELQTYDFTFENSTARFYFGNILQLTDLPIPRVFYSHVFIDPPQELTTADWDQHSWNYSEFKTILLQVLALQKKNTKPPTIVARISFEQLDPLTKALKELNWNIIQKVFSCILIYNCQIFEYNPLRSDTGGQRLVSSVLLRVVAFQDGCSDYHTQILILQQDKIV